MRASLRHRELHLPGDLSRDHRRRKAARPVERRDRPSHRRARRVSPRRLAAVSIFAAPLLAGFLPSNTSARAAVAVFAAAGLVLALWGTLSPSIKQAPSLTALEDVPREPSFDVGPSATG